MKCELTGCEAEVSAFDPTRPRTDGVLIQVMTTGKTYMVCTGCALKLGLIR